MNKLLIVLSTSLMLIHSIQAISSLTVNTGLGSTADAALQAEIDKQFQVPTMSNFLKSMSNAQSITNKGQGVSYATDHSLFVVGGGFGAGLSGDLASGFKSNGGLPAIGVGVQGSLMAGLSLSKLPVPALGPIDLKRVTLFVNYFGISNDSLVNSLTIKANTFGMHAQYKVIEGKNIGGIGILNWGGIAFTSGFDVSSNSLTYKVGQSISVESSGTTFTWTPNSASNLTLESNSFSIPFEISTSVRVLYVLSVFAGAGIDLNFGKSTIAANLNGPVTNSSNSTTGSASLQISEEQGPNVGHLRFFVGPQFNLVPLKNTNLLSVYAQFNASTGGNYGAHAGARIAW
jgi:hypothetical protein